MSYAKDMVRIEKWLVDIPKEVIWAAIRRVDDIEASKTRAMNVVTLFQAARAKKFEYPLISIRGAGNATVRVLRKAITIYREDMDREDMDREEDERDLDTDDTIDAGLPGIVAPPYSEMVTTRRDLFAMAALTGLLAQHSGMHRTAVAEAYVFADMMETARKSPAPAEEP